MDFRRELAQARAGEKRRELLAAGRRRAKQSGFRSIFPIRSTAIIEQAASSPAMLMKNHGVFAIGSTPQAVVKAAVMVEDVTRTVFPCHPARPAAKDRC